MTGAPAIRNSLQGDSGERQLENHLHGGEGAWRRHRSAGELYRSRPGLPRLNCAPGKYQLNYIFSLFNLICVKNLGTTQMKTQEGRLKKPQSYKRKLNNYSIYL